MNKLKKIFMLLRFLPASPAIPWNNQAFLEDLMRWKKICRIDGSDFQSAAALLWYKREFRNLLLYRLSRRSVSRLWVRLFYKPLESLYIEAFEIGGGLFIQHGFATMITARSIGKNCWINQQVTIGYGKGSQAPALGDNVTVTCGAKVLGDITVGDGATIGANAVVIRDVEPSAVMVGVPAHRIR